MHSFLKLLVILFSVDRVDLEWKIIYVGSAESDAFDQVLDSVLVGPVPLGRHTFVFQVRSKRHVLWLDLLIISDNS